jgi:colicin import membrane protein
MSDTAEKTTDSRDLIVIRQLTPAIFADSASVEDILAKLEREVRAIPRDISTEDGRAAIASLAYKVARSKTALDEMGKELVAEWKAKANLVDAERRKVRDRCDALKEEVRKPLTEWEEADKRRIEAHEKAILDLQALLDFGGQEPTAAQLKERIDILAARPARQWEEFIQRASDATMFVGRRLEDLHAAAVKREAERAELERLRREQAEREQQERDERIAAAAAERARLEAEAKAKREAEEAAERAAAEQRRVEREKAEAVARAEKAEADRKAAVAKAENDKIAAVEAERRRVADEQAKEAAASARREANTRHRAKVNGAARDSLIKIGLTAEHATAVVTAIAKGEVPNVSISY